MEPIFAEATEKLKGEWERVLLYSRLPQWEEDHPIVRCYQRGKESVECYIREILLPRLENLTSEERRHYRLHQRKIEVSYCCSGKVIGERFWSIRLQVHYHLPEGNRAEESWRVWDLDKGVICPIDLFLSRQTSKGLHRWSFALSEDSLWGYPKNGGEGKWIARTGGRIGAD